MQKRRWTGAEWIASVKSQLSDSGWSRLVSSELALAPRHDTISAPSNQRQALGGGARPYN